TAVVVGEGGRLLGGHRQVDTTEAAEEVAEEALLQQLPGGVPVTLAGQGQLVEVAAGPARGGDGRGGEGLGNHRDGSAGPAVSVEDHAVVVAVDGIGGVGAGAFGAGLSHDVVLAGCLLGGAPGWTRPVQSIMTERGANRNGAQDCLAASVPRALLG